MSGASIRCSASWATPGNERRDADADRDLAFGRRCMRDAQAFDRVAQAFADVEGHGERRELLGPGLCYEIG
jgi:hypothetical protein